MGAWYACVLAAAATGCLASAADTRSTALDDSRAAPEQFADAETATLTYSWSLLKVPVGSTATLSAPDAVIPAFVADLPGTYVAQLIVSDGVLSSAPATVTITVIKEPLLANGFETADTSGWSSASSGVGG